VRLPGCSPAQEDNQKHSHSTQHRDLTLRYVLCWSPSRHRSKNASTALWRRQLPYLPLLIQAAKKANQPPLVLTQTGTIFQEGRRRSTCGLQASLADALLFSIREAAILTGWGSGASMASSPPRLCASVCGPRSHAHHRHDK